jgi:hypothetical protein
VILSPQQQLALFEQSIQGFERGGGGQVRARALFSGNGPAPVRHQPRMRSPAAPRLRRSFRRPADGGGASVALAAPRVALGSFGPQGAGAEAEVIIQISGDAGPLRQQCHSAGEAHPNSLAIR